LFDINTANLCFDIAGMVVTLTVLWLIYRRLNVNSIFVWMLAGAVMHIASLCLRIYLIISGNDAPGSTVIAYRVCIFTAHILFLAAVIKSIIYAAGRVMSNDSLSRGSYNLFIIFAAFLPQMVSAGFYSQWQVRSGGFAASVTMLIVCEYLEARRQRDLDYREQTVKIRQAKIMSEQMRPHFIYNSLMSIQYLIHTDPEAAADCLNDFSGYLRGSIDALTSEKPIPFKTELEHIRQFVKLERAGSPYDFKMESDFEAEDFMIPALTVQPIVENAVKHGALSRRDGTGTVRITTRFKGEYIQIVVEDNGIPVSMTEKESQHRSIGIDNARARLAAQCGGTLTVKHTDTGTTAIITVPKEVV